MPDERECQCLTDIYLSELCYASIYVQIVCSYFPFCNRRFLCLLHFEFYAWIARHVLYAFALNSAWRRSVFDMRLSCLIEQSMVQAQQFSFPILNSFFRRFNSIGILKNVFSALLFNCVNNWNGDRETFEKLIRIYFFDCYLVFQKHRNKNDGNWQFGKHGGTLTIHRRPQLHVLGIYKYIAQHTWGARRTREPTSS